MILFLLLALTIAQATHVVNNCKSSINIQVRESATGGSLVAAAPNSSPRPRSHTAPAPAPNIRSASPQCCPPPAATTKLNPHARSKNVIPLIAAPSGALLLVLVCCISTSYFIYRRSKSRNKSSLVLESSLLLPKQFKYRELAAATANFDTKFQLGEGGFGSVFKATLSDGSIVAVKRMTGATKRPGYGQFKAEVESLGSIHHLNLVKLKGFCMRGLDECMLVYEYMPNGSLDKWIFKKGGQIFLNWSKRMSIALEVAHGLAYLHGGCCERILHLDIKPQNILLDENFRAKISDFGLAKLVDRDKSQVVTLHLRGTPGYMAPEWLQSVVTDKSDVFSYGVLVLQIVSSKSTLEFPTHTDSDIKILSELASDMFQSRSLEVLVDERLHDDESLSMVQVEKLVQVGLWCIQSEPSLRPSMDTVVKMLQGLLDVPDPPVSSTHTAL